MWNLEQDLLTCAIAIPSVIFFCVLLLTVGLAITATGDHERIRRHGTTVDGWQLPAEYSDRLADVSDTYEPVHHVIDGVLVDEHTGELPIMEPHLSEIESWPQVGRRGVYSIVRQHPQAPNWVPPIGDVRVALLETPTAQYAIVRRQR